MVNPEGTRRSAKVKPHHHLWGVFWGGLEVGGGEFAFAIFRCRRISRFSYDRPKEPADNTHDLYAVRLQKLENLCVEGQPFMANCEQSHTSAEAVQLYKEGVPDEEQPRVSIAGRIVAFVGKASFIKLQDRDGQIQCYVTRDELPEGEYNTYFKKLDLGDIIGVTGRLFVTKTGEITVRARATPFGTRPLPEKWAGLKDDDKIYRQRYLDLIMNQESRNRFKQRANVIRAMREYLWERDFTEVETPVLQGVAGGAAARPFVTHFNALDCDFYMRIALELYLKRMLVGGEDRVFEIGRVFRNEGLSRRHNPEFTMLELYQAYTDYRGMMELTKGLIQHVVYMIGCRNRASGRRDYSAWWRMARSEVWDLS